MKSRLFTAILLAVSVRAGAGENGFMGHYGYLVGYPSSFSAQPSFQGPIEVVQFMPPTKCSQDQKACAKLGWVNLSVFPKKLIKDANGMFTYSAFMDAVLKESKADGEKPTATPMKAGKLGGTTFALASPKGPFDRMVYIEGKKVYYRFAYDSKNKNAEKIVQGLSEVEPNDDPPPGSH